MRALRKLPADSTWGKGRKRLALDLGHGREMCFVADGPCTVVWVGEYDDDNCYGYANEFGSTRTDLLEWAEALVAELKQPSRSVPVLSLKRSKR